ncbi:fungal-specific transcription factor domain-containing protein [Fusarium oxysporum]|nr:fungal-specific transcription factor domain-containing protein [Fusarium oxysporum]
MESNLRPTKPCHNCRYNRLSCDRSVPACCRCTTTGKNCLGYGKLWRWVDAVASRGKMAGKKVPNAKESWEFSTTSHTKANATRNTIVLANRGQRVDSYRTSAYSNLGTLGPHYGLCDPSLSNVSIADRYYLSYFTKGLCPQLVAIDLPGYNPFPELVSMGAASPLLLYTVVTAAAAHMSNVLRPGANKWSSQPQNIRNYDWDPSRRALADALVAKQKALCLLRMALIDEDVVGNDMVLTAVIMLVTADMIDSGKHDSQAHVNAMGWLLSQAPPMTGVGEMLKDFIISDCYIHYVFALTFMDQVPKSLSDLDKAFASSAIHYAARNSFICCPAEILQIMWSTATILKDQPTLHGAYGRSEKGLKLMLSAMSFDVASWSCNIENVPRGRQVTDINSRTHSGYTHQMACCLYILYAIPSVRNFLPEGTEQSLEAGLMCHLRSITDEDPNFKTSFWPTFVAGAQTRDAYQQIWIKDRMLRQLRLFPWGFLYTAIETLQLIWERRNVQSELNWLQILRNPEVSFLIV